MADSVPLCVFRCRYGFTAFGSVFGIIVRFENKDAYNQTLYRFVCVVE